MVADKQFLWWSLPIALTAFVAGPLAVLHSFDFTTKRYDHNLQLSTNSSIDHLPDTIPLLFEVEKYLQSHDLRLMNLTTFADMVETSTELKTPGAFVGYMSVTEVLRQMKRNLGSYPIGDLLLVTDVSFTGFDDEAGEREVLVLETQRYRRFRLKSVQYDESTGLLFGQVDWIGEQKA